jgi:hypothetical protein
MSAFSAAILDQLSSPDKDIYYDLIAAETVTSCLAKDYFIMRPEEVGLLRECISQYKDLSILDIGCCIGRHSRFALSCNADTKINIVEKDDTLRQVTFNELPINNAYKSVDEINGASFNIIFMMGLGLGIFGDEASTKLGLVNIISLLASGGTLLIEGGKSSPGLFTTQNFQIKYGVILDEPFEWGYATFEWFSSFIEEINGIRIVSVSPSSNGDDYFICKLTKI